MLRRISSSVLLPLLLVSLQSESDHAFLVSPERPSSVVRSRSYGTTTTGPSLHQEKASSSSLKLHASSSARETSPTDTTTTTTSTTTTTTTTTLKTYEYNGWNLTYLYKPASSKKYEGEPPLLLVHPVGIGMSSWFWEKFMNAWEKQDGGHPALYAVDLIGCGAAHGADAWNPDERGLSIPLGWVKACEALMSQQQINQQQSSSSSSSSSSSILSSLFSTGSSSSSTTPLPYNVVVQGGLAPIGVLLASRNPQIVQRVIFTSPPAWKEMTTPVPERELALNYNFLKSPLLGGLAFTYLLESRGAVEFFSNLFLFANGACDETWISNCMDEACEAVRPPVQVFNAGFCFHRSYQDELQTQIQQPVLILQGDQDKERIPQRQEYMENMVNCKLQTIPNAKNVLPWESPEDTVKAVQAFCGLDSNYKDKKRMR